MLTTQGHGQRRSFCVRYAGRRDVRQERIDDIANDFDGTAMHTATVNVEQALYSAGSKICLVALLAKLEHRRAHVQAVVPIEIDIYGAG